MTALAATCLPLAVSSDQRKLCRGTPIRLGKLDSPAYMNIQQKPCWAHSKPPTPRSRESWRSSESLHLPC